MVTLTFEKALTVSCKVYSEEDAEKELGTRIPKTPFLEFDELKFDKWFNIVYAPNGTGKTTLTRSFLPDERNTFSIENLFTEITFDFDKNKTIDKKLFHVIPEIYYSNLESVDGEALEIHSRKLALVEGDFFKEAKSLDECLNFLKNLSINANVEYIIYYLINFIIFGKIYKLFSKKNRNKEDIEKVEKDIHDLHEFIENNEEDIEKVKKDIHDLHEFVENRFKIDYIEPYKEIFEFNKEQYQNILKECENIVSDISNKAENNLFDSIKEYMDKLKENDDIFLEKTNGVLKKLGYKDYHWVRRLFDLETFSKSFYEENKYKTQKDHYVYHTQMIQQNGIINRYFLNEGLKNIMKLAPALNHFKGQNLSKRTIVIDDPLRSTDDIRTKALCEYIADFLIELSDRIDRVIILTHKLDVVSLMTKTIRDKLSAKGKEYMKVTWDNVKELKNVSIKEIVKEAVGIKELYIHEYKNKHENDSESKSEYPVIRMSSISKENENLFLDKYKYYFAYIYDIMHSKKQISPINADCHLAAFQCRHLLEMFFGWYKGATSINDIAKSDKNEAILKDDKWKQFLSKNEINNNEMPKISLKDLLNALGKFIHATNDPNHSDGTDPEKDQSVENITSIVMAQYPTYTLGFIYCASPEHYESYEKYAKEYKKEKDESRKNS